MKILFGRNCNLNEFGNWIDDISYSETYQLGGTPDPLLNGEPLMHFLFQPKSAGGTVGYKAVLDYGGNNSPYGAGWRSPSPVGAMPICSRYTTETGWQVPFFYDTWHGQRSGMATWQLPTDN